MIRIYHGAHEGTEKRFPENDVCLEQTPFSENVYYWSRMRFWLFFLLFSYPCLAWQAPCSPRIMRGLRDSVVSFSSSEVRNNMVTGNTTASEAYKMQIINGLCNKRSVNNP